MVKVINRSSKTVDEDRVKSIVEKVLKDEIGDVDVNVVFVDSNEMERLNERFRGVEGPTDVLTFPYHDEDVYGEIVVCLDVVEKNANRFTVPYEEELLTVLIHGVLHLAGYDHEREDRRSVEMFRKQKEYVEKMKKGGKE